MIRICRGLSGDASPRGCGKRREWLAHQPDARLLVAEGAGHCPHYERPHVALDAIERFLEGTSPEGTVQIP